MPVTLAHWTIVTIVGAFVGSWLAGYFRRKAENLATHEDIDKLVDQVRAVTQATKEVEASISDRAWNRQKHWELKREAVFSVMQALGHADDNLSALALAVEKKVQGKEVTQQTIQQASELFYHHIDDFDEKRALAMIVCGDDMNNTLLSLKNGLRLVAAKLLNGEAEAYEESKAVLKPYFARTFALSRHELGIEVESTAPS